MNYAHTSHVRELHELAERIGDVVVRAAVHRIAAQISKLVQSQQFELRELRRALRGGVPNEPSGLVIGPTYQTDPSVAAKLSR